MMTIIKIIFVLLMLFPLTLLMRFFLVGLRKDMEKTKFFSTDRETPSDPAGSRKKDHKKAKNLKKTGKRKTAQKQSGGGDGSANSRRSEITSPGRGSRTADSRSRHPKQLHRSERVPFGASLDNRRNIGESENPLSQKTASDRNSLRTEEIGNTGSQREKGEHKRGRSSKARSKKPPTKRQLRKNRERARKRDIRRREKERQE